MTTLAALAFAAALQTDPAADAEAARVEAVLERLDAAATAGDGSAYFALFTPQARFVGTDATEHWSLEEFRVFAEPYFSRGRGWAYPETWRRVTIAPIECRCVAWFEERLANAGYGETRGSGVLRMVDGEWKIEQYVLSFAVPNDRAAAVVEAIRGADAD